MGGRLARLARSFGCALRGVWLCLRGERNFRIHLTAACYVALFAWLGGVEPMGCALLALCFGLMLGAELLNTAAERLGDRLSTDFDPLVRDAKDLAAGGVLACAAACAAAGFFLFIPSGALLRALAVLTASTPRMLALALSMLSAAWFIFCAGRA